MKAHDVIRMNLDSARWMLGEYLKDMNDSDLMVRPVPGANHLAWQLGHLISSGNTFLEGLKSGSAPALPHGFTTAYTTETSKVDDPKVFHTKQRYSELVQAQFEAAQTLLGQFSETDLDKPGPEEMREWAPTIGSVLNMFGGHIMMHIGQFTVVRRKLGKPLLF